MQGGLESLPPPEIFRFELSSASEVEFCSLKWTAFNGSYSFQVLSIIVRLCNFVLLCNLELGFSAFILKVLQCFHKSRRKRNLNEITDYFVCTGNARAWMSCILCPYAPALTIWKNTRLIKALNNK